MNIVEIVFSPTGGTEKAANLIAKCWNGDATQIDLSNAKTNFSKCEIDSEDMVLIAMPSYGGRAPAIAIERLKQIKGNGARCTLVCVYGNRAYENTLAEMESAAKESGFQVIAAVAAVAEHSIVPRYAAGRPDVADEKQLADFAKQIESKDGGTVSVPGNLPDKKSGGAGLVPWAGKDCTQCGQCVAQCPSEAIDPVDFMADHQKCISCMRCVRRCPSGARKVNGVLVSIAALAIKKACSDRKENELFL